jgi:hypothetical protein
MARTTTKACTEGEQLADGSVVATIITAEDVRSVLQNHFRKTCTLEHAQRWLDGGNAVFVSVAVTEGWFESLAEGCNKLRMFADQLPTRDADS